MITVTWLFSFIVPCALFYALKMFFFSEKGSTGSQRGFYSKRVRNLCAWAHPSLHTHSVTCMGTPPHTHIHSVTCMGTPHTHIHPQCYMHGHTYTHTHSVYMHFQRIHTLLPGHSRPVSNICSLRTHALLAKIQDSRPHEGRFLFCFIFLNPHPNQSLIGTDLQFLLKLYYCFWLSWISIYLFLPQIRSVYILIK